MRRQALRTQERGGNQDSAKGKNRSGPQFQVCLQLQHANDNRHAVAKDVVIGTLVASRNSRPSYRSFGSPLRKANSSAFLWTVSRGGSTFGPWTQCLYRTNQDYRPRKQSLRHPLAGP